MILDDIWEAEHERLLNFIDTATAPASKVLVTTRFAKLLPGYVEVALGLLSDDEAVELQPRDFRVGEYYSSCARNPATGCFEVTTRVAPYWRHGFPHTNR